MILAHFGHFDLPAKKESPLGILYVMQVRNDPKTRPITNTIIAITSLDVTNHNT